MSVPVRAVAGLLALLAASCAGSIAAQAAPEGRAWTDPPARGAALTPDSDTAKVAASPATSGPHAGDLKPRAAVSEPKTAPSKRRVAAPKPRIAAVRPRPAAVSAPVRPAARTRIAAPVRSRTADSRVRYGFLAPPPPGMVYVARAQRIRQAEVAGYFVVRRSTFATPDGRLVYGYRPYDADDE